jgi:hypothetical protein
MKRNILGNIKGKMPFERESFVWRHFMKKESGDKAQCKHCQRELACKGSSTTGLLRHLSGQHNIKGPSDSQSMEASSSASLEPPAKKGRQLSIEDAMKKKETLEEIVARLASSDGFSVNAITHSKFIRESLQQRGFFLPRNPSKVMSLIKTFFQKVINNVKEEIGALKEKQVKFSISLDEFTSTRNRRYLNINLHHLDKFWNLGLVRIQGSLPAHSLLEMVENHLSLFNLSTTSDIVSSVNDGASVMVCFGNLAPFDQQLCFAHGIHLAVLDVIYQKTTIQVKREDEDDEEEEEDVEEEEDESLEEVFEIQEDLLPVITKVRKVAKMFKRSPVKNEILQKHVKEELGKELSLLLDCRTRWNSLEKMIERFLLLKRPVSKALIDLQDTSLSLTFSMEECSLLEELLKALAPIKLASERLGSRDANLLTAEGVFKFLFGTLEKNNSELSNKLLDALKMRIEERKRGDLVSLLKFLNDPSALNDPEMPSKAVLTKNAKILLHRLFPDENAEQEPLDDSTEDEEIRDGNLKGAMERAISNACATKSKKGNIASSLTKEIGLFEATGKITPNLNLLKNALLSIKPTSVESERAFSAAGQFVTRLRMRLNDDSVNMLVVLKSHFKNM